MNKIIKSFMTILGLSCFLVACGQSKVSSNEPKEKPLDKLNITYVTAPLNVPSIIEKEQKIFANDLHTEIAYSEITSGAEQSQALAAGKVQILHAIGGSSVIAAYANGADIKILNMYSRAPEAFALFAKDKSLNSAQSLKGKTIAGPAGTNLHELLVSYLQKSNLTIKDVNFLNMSIPDALAALGSGKIDVAMLGGPAAYKAEKNGLHKVTDGKGFIEATICVATSNKFYNEHRDVIDKFMKAQEEIREFMKNKPEEAKAIVKKALKLDDVAYDTMYKQYDFSLKVSDKDVQGLQNTADFMFNNGMIKHKVNAKDLFLQH